MGKIILSATGIKKDFQIGNSLISVLRGVDIDFEEGKIIAIVGKSGAGKSTFLHICGLLARPTEGELKHNGEDLFKKNDTELAVFRNRFVGFIFQFHNLLPEFNALENVVMPSLISGNTFSESKPRAEYLLERVGLSERITHRPGELSGGELQRVSVARALMNEPSLVLADEPSGNLDNKNSEILHELIWELARENNYSFVIVTHDMNLAKKADKIVMLKEGLTAEIQGEKINEQIMM